MTKYLHNFTEEEMSNIDKKMKGDFLLNHPGYEADLATNNELKEFFNTHVIIDEEDWLRARQIVSAEKDNCPRGISDKEVLGYHKGVKHESDPSSRPPIVGTREPIKPIGGIKYDSDKPRFDLIPADALEEVAKAYAVGADRYGDRNWEKGLSYGRLFGAMMRHAWAWWKGERTDESNKFNGVPVNHLASVIFCALALLHYDLNSGKFCELDDRNEEKK